MSTTQTRYFLNVGAQAFENRTRQESNIAGNTSHFALCSHHSEWLPEFSGSDTTTETPYVAPGVPEFDVTREASAGD